MSGTNGTSGSSGLLPGIGATTNLIFRDTGAPYGYSASTFIYVDASAGALYATEKHFIINHPTKEDKFLVYGSLESPYNGVQLTGRNTIKIMEFSGQMTPQTKAIQMVELPEYISSLIHDDNVSIQITNIGHHKNICVHTIRIDQNYFEVKLEDYVSGEYEFFWTMTGERKDIEKLETEKNKN